MDNPVIDPKNLPTWTAAGFVLALLALSAALVGLYRTNHVAVVTQAEVMTLKQQLNSMSAAPASPAQQAAAAQSK